MYSIADAINNDDRVVLFDSRKHLEKLYDNNADYIEIKQNGRFIQMNKREDENKKSFITVKIKHNTITTALGLYNRTISKSEKDFLKHYAGIKRLTIRI